MTEFADAARRVRGGADAAAEAAALVGMLTDDEVIDLLDGDVPFWPGLTDMTSGGYYRHAWPAARNARLGIPGFAFTDGPRGVVVGNATCFPVAMARAATFDVALEEEIGRVIGLEARAVGATYFGGVCVNLLRHPAWGRAQETYGEDPHLLGEMGAALTRGVQEHVLACVKHFACNSMENARFTVDVTADERALHEVYLPHFKRVVDEGVASVMSSYNSLNGEWAGQSHALLTDVLRDEWGFDGLRHHRLHLRAARPGRVGARRPRRRDAVRPAAGGRAAGRARRRRDHARRARRARGARRRDAAALRRPRRRRRRRRCRCWRRPSTGRSPGVRPRSRSCCSPTATASCPSARRHVRADRGARPTRRGAEPRRRRLVGGAPAGGRDAARRAPRRVRRTPTVVHADTDASIAADADLVVVVVGYTKADEGEYIESTNADLFTLFPPVDDPRVGREAPVPPLPPAPPALELAADEATMATGGDRRTPPARRRRRGPDRGGRAARTRARSSRS